MRKAVAAPCLPVLWALVLASGLALASPGPAGAPAGEGPVDGLIEATAGPEVDRAIAQRLRSIYSELDGLEPVRVDVAAGVVTVSGEVLSAGLHEQAVSLAKQVEGVVAVNDGITEARDVRRRIAPVMTRLRARTGDILSYAPLLAVATLVFAMFWGLAALAVRADRPYRRLAPNVFLRDALRQAVRSAILLAGFILALDILDATALLGTVLGAAGILGLALGFALRDTVENYIASLLLSLRHPFAHDDHVVIEGHEGRVVRLTSRATLLMTLDGNHVRIPNAVVYKGVIINYTRNPRRRFQFDVGLGTSEDLSMAQRIAADTVLAMDGVMQDPPPVSTIEALGDSTVVMRVTGWVDQSRAEFIKVRSEAIRLVKQALDAADVSMPEPSYALRMAGPVPPPVDPTAAPGVTVQRRHGPKVAVDIGLHEYLRRQIAEDRRDEEDLLTDRAPKE